MKKVALITDSTCDLPKEWIKQYDIKVIPLQIIYKEAEYQDGIDLTTQEIYDNLDKEVPKTSLPSIGKTLDFIDDLKAQEYTDILAIHISGNLSGTVKMLESLREKITNKGLNLYIIDSKSVSMGVGFLVLKAKSLLDEDLALSEIVEKLESFKKEIKVFFVVKTLDFLRKGGRIGLVEGAIGDILNIKPIIGVNEEGVYHTEAKVRGWNRALNKLFETAKDVIGNKKAKIGILHGVTIEEANNLVEKSKNELKTVSGEDIMIGYIGAGICVHSGPEVVGIVVCPEE
ncbi:EDD domain protein, DegV family [Desulfonispora thiosulfatigenes DSM 11270]|uniref:EDD domain protein, DegV family n=1 Tax=Desulfonispora thiosulfatigenes DSM 11270 TaxID=656914 RepID=A0A1W1VG42_DESTI|nr:DegV family protein [Desulfonispora thiosulfatigenes]SMB92315.1 EDD domain protein, DegV family [Desulfonispora thiosulfatigenes DSM 11270]